MPFVRPIVINGKQVSTNNGTTLASYPILICGVYSWLKSVANGGNVISASGYDIWFSTDSQGVDVIPFERVAWDQTTGHVEFWVNIALLAPNALWPASGQTIYMAYGDASVTSDRSSPAAVWDGNYVAVWHFGDGVTLSLADSTANGNNGTNHSIVAGAGLLASGTTPSSFKGGGAVFSGAQYASVADSSSLRITGAITIEDYHNYDPSFGSGIIWGIVHKVATSPLNGYELQLFPDLSGGGLPELNGYLAGAQQVCPAYTALGGSPSTPIWSADTWDNVATAVSWIPLGYAIQPRGIPGTRTWTTPAIGASTGAALLIGYGNGRSGLTGGDYYVGTLDEIRISNIIRSPDWLATAQNTTQNPGADGAVNNNWFYAIGAATFVVPCPGTGAYGWTG